MNWLGNRIFKRDAAAESVDIEQHLLSLNEPQDNEREKTREPPLVLLASDASGPAARRVHCFCEADAAARFIEFWYPESRESSLVAYWLLPGEPSPRDCVERECELLLLVRDGSRPGIVYAFSLADMAAVRSFLHQETQYGLELRSVLLLWSIRVRIDTDFRGKVTLSPAALPQDMVAGNSAVTALAEKEMAAALALQRQTAG